MAKPAHRHTPYDKFCTELDAKEKAQTERIKKLVACKDEEKWVVLSKPLHVRFWGRVVWSR
jgi:hypothetical protein